MLNSLGNAQRAQNDHTLKLLEVKNKIKICVAVAHNNVCAYVCVYNFFIFLMHAHEHTHTLFFF